MIDVNCTAARSVDLNLSYCVVIARNRLISLKKRSARKALGSIFSKSGSACVISASWPCVRSRATGLPRASQMAWIFVVNPPRDRPMA